MPVPSLQARQEEITPVLHLNAVLKDPTLTTASLNLLTTTLATLTTAAAIGTPVPEPTNINSLDASTSSYTTITSITVATPTAATTSATAPLIPATVPATSSPTTTATIPLTSAVASSPSTIAGVPTVSQSTATITTAVLVSKISSTTISTCQTGNCTGLSCPAALTTIFHPASTCLDHIYSLTPGGVLELAPTQVPGCYPSAGRTLYSPGLCPTGYMANSGLVPVGSSSCATKLYTRTDLWCCPSFFTYENVSSSCILSINKPTSTGGIFNILVTPSSTFSTEVEILQGSLYTATKIETMGLLVIRAPVFHVQYESTDTGVSTIWAPVLDSLTAASAAQPTGNVTSSIYPKLDDTVTRVSSGAIAGIVIGALAGLSLLIGAIYTVLKRRKRRDQTARGEEEEARTEDWTKQELAGNPVLRAELDGNKDLKEMARPEVPPVELPDNRLYVEPQEMGASPINIQVHRGVNPVLH